MRTSATIRVEKHRASLRALGMRPIQIWVPDTRQPGFQDECQRQSQLASSCDQQDQDLSRFMDEALSDLDNA